MLQNRKGKTSTSSAKHVLDTLDFELVDLLHASYSNSQIATITKRPLSTIQRRTKKLIDQNYLSDKHQINYNKLGYMQGLVHVYLTNGDSRLVVDQLVKLDHIVCASAHIGNSDVVANYVCKEPSQLLELMNKIKQIHGIEKVVWSEQVYEARSNKAISGKST